MSICTPCTRLKSVAICTNSLVIGTVATHSTSYNVYFRSLANDMVVKYTTTSSVAGLLTLTPTAGFILAANTLYEVWVNKTNSNLTGENLTIGTTTATCYTIMFERVNDATYTSQTFELE